MHLNEKAKQFPFLVHIMQHCPSLYFVLFLSCHANKTNFKKKKSLKSVHPISLLSPLAVSTGRNPFFCLPSYFRCFHFFPNCDPVSFLTVIQYLYGSPVAQETNPDSLYPMCSIHYSMKLLFPEVFYCGFFFFPKPLQKWDFSFSVKSVPVLLRHPLFLIHLSVSGWSSHCIFHLHHCSIWLSLVLFLLLIWLYWTVIPLQGILHGSHGMATDQQSSLAGTKDGEGGSGCGVRGGQSLEAGGCQQEGSFVLALGTSAWHWLLPLLGSNHKPMY